MPQKKKASKAQTKKKPASKKKASSSKAKKTPKKWVKTKLNPGEKKLTNPNFEYVCCNLCGADDYRVVYDGEPEEGLEEVRYKSSGNEIGNDRIVRCNVCDLQYVNPRLKPEIIFGGYAEGSDETFVSQAKGREITFKRCLDFVEKNVDEELRTNKGKILDIGTAGGSFLKVCKEAGWETYGVEPNKWLCEWGNKNYGLNIKPGDLFSQKYKDNSFDVVTLWDVLEHVPDPKATLEEVNRILKPNGYVVVNYPDIGSSIARAMGRKWVFILTVHLYYFTPKTIKKMLRATGYEPTKLKPHFQTLSLGYLVYRMEAYNKFLNKVGEKVVGTLGIGKWQIPYWLGQTLVMGKKTK